MSLPYAWTKRKEAEEIGELAARKLRNFIEKGKKGEITYPPFSGRYGVRSSFPFATTSPANQRSTCRRQWCGRLGFAGRLGFGRRFLARYRDVDYCNFFLPTRGIVTSVPEPSFLLCVPFKDG